MDAQERVQFHRDFERALSFATQLHSGQTRKQTDIPYISHLIGVAGIVLENDGDRDQAIAALLHDSIEDCGASYPGGVAALRAHLRTEFGAAVLSIVDGCTDATTMPKPPWRDRKEAYIEHLRHAPAAVRLVSCADKLHNARAIVADLRVMGDALFDRFTGGKDGTLWYYETLAEVFAGGGPAGLAAELGRTVETMRWLVDHAEEP
jgi:(p)ppGpp synthase/HD superfamily hydrolase